MLQVLRVHSAGTGLYTFRSAAAFTIQPNSLLLPFMGFDATINNVASVVYVMYPLSSPNAIDLTGNNSFYFTTNLNTGNYNFVSPTGYGRGSNILAKMQLDVAIGGVVFFRDQTNFMNRFSNQSLTYINVVLYDENFDP